MLARPGGVPSPSSPGGVQICPAKAPQLAVQLLLAVPARTAALLAPRGELAALLAQLPHLLLPLQVLSGEPRVATKLG